MGHRYYSRSNCRCVTRDPIGYAGGINLYGFCRNNPVNYADPWGFCGDGNGEPDTLKIGINVNAVLQIFAGGQASGTWWFDTHDTWPTQWTYSGFQDTIGDGVGLGVGATAGIGPAFSYGPNPMAPGIYNTQTITGYGADDLGTSGSAQKPITEPTVGPKTTPWYSPYTGPVSYNGTSPSFSLGIPRLNLGWGVGYIVSHDVSVNLPADQGEMR